jgi:hypothetical protein
VCYELLDADFPIRQGDIFYPLPYVEISLTNIQSLRKVGPADVVVQLSDWDSLKDNDEIIISTALGKTWGIVATQNCDASRIPNISLFQIDLYTSINPTPPASPKKWVETITERVCRNASWFYLPKDERLGINERMAVNFHKVFQIPREDLETNIRLRKGRLVKVAFEHFRESIAQYYRRYPYNEWYSFDKDEIDWYLSKGKCTSEDLYPWQK